MPDQKKTSQRTTKTPATKNLKSRKKTFRRSEVAAENARPEKKIPAFRGAIENARPEKKQFCVQVRLPKIVDQKITRPRAAQLTTLRKKCATRKTHFGVQWRPRTTRDQKNIAAFRGGHRKFATRKTTFWRSRAAISNARPETKTTSNGNKLA